MKTKKTIIFARILSILLILCFAFVCVGCMGRSPSDNDDDFGDLGDGGGGGDGTQEELLIDLYGTKVLYHPDNYDFSKGAGGTDENPKDYYGEYAWWIINELIEVYGFANQAKIQTYASSTISASEYPLFFDNIRYKVDALGSVTKAKTVSADGTTTTVDLETDEQYILVGFNTQQSWKMTFDYDLSALNNAYSSLLYQKTNYTVSSSRKYAAFDSMDDLTQKLNAMYSVEDFKTYYNQIMLGSSSADDSANYSDYVKALQYAIYCYAVDITPGTVQVTVEDNVTSATQDYYTLSIVETDANNTQTTLSVDDALTNAKSRFKKLGTYVGLTDSQISKIADWVKINVIGYETKVSNDNFHRYAVVTEVTTTDASGNETVTYEFDMLNYSASPFGRNYSSAVEKIVDASAQKVTIGRDGETAVTINNRFIASEICEYYGDTFIIAGDENFPKYTEGQSSTAIRPLEYQSVLLMPKSTLELTDICIALKYDADLDGTTDGVWGSRYLDIIVELNYFSSAKQKSFKIGSQQTRVYDGPYELSPDGFDYDHGTLFFGDFTDYCRDTEFRNLVKNGAITIGQFKTSIGGEDFITDVGKSGYNGLPLVSKSPLTIIGSRTTKDFYSIVEPKPNELVYQTQTYSSGKLNEEKFKGNNGCDYLEINYKVIKNKGDTNTNYKFYTGIAAIF